MQISVCLSDYILMLVKKASPLIQLDSFVFQIIQRMLILVGWAAPDTPILQGCRSWCLHCSKEIVAMSVFKLHVKDSEEKGAHKLKKKSLSAVYLLATHQKYELFSCFHLAVCFTNLPSKRNVRGVFKCSASWRHQVVVGRKGHARLLSWPKSTMCCSGCCCWATRASARRACCGGSPRASSTPLTSPPSVGDVACGSRRLGS